MPLPAHLAVDVLMSETATGNIGRIRLYYAVVSGDDPTVENVQGYANDFKAAYNTAVPACLTSAHSFFAVNIRWLGVTADIEAKSNVAGAAGTRAVGVFPEEVAACIQRRTGVKGRQNRGRVFMPFVPLLFANGSTLSTTGVEAYQSLGNMIKSNVECEDAATSNVATFAPRTPNFKQGVLNPVVQTRVLSELASRRDRRFVKRGEPITSS